MALHVLTFGQSAKLWWGRKKIRISDHMNSTSWGTGEGGGVHTILIKGQDGGRILEMTKEDARALCFILFDLTEDPKDEAKPAES